MLQPRPQSVSSASLASSAPRAPSSTSLASSSSAPRAPSSSTLTDDYSDYLMSPASTEHDKVSFKTEVAQSPSHSGGSNNDDSAGEECPCKEEVEQEEAKALVEALEQSEVEQSVLPYVPGLSPDVADNTVTIRVSDEVRICSYKTCAFKRALSVERHACTCTCTQYMYMYPVHVCLNYHDVHV